VQEKACFWVLCFVPPEATSTPRVFGFAEFLAALALLVVLFTIIDVRYRFRLAVSPIPLYAATFALIAMIGGGTLTSEVWLAQGWWVPRTPVTRVHLQASFALMFLAAFLVWTWIAFIKPPIFGRLNAKRYAGTLYSVILKGDEAELRVIANEAQRSMRNIVRLARRAPAGRRRKGDGAEPERTAETPDFSRELLLLIADRRFCRSIVASSPATAMALFNAMTEERRYDLPTGPFARALTAEAIANKDSLLHHESDEFAGGLLGYVKPWSKTIFGDFALHEATGGDRGSPLDVDYRETQKWDAEQWETYERAVLVALQGALEAGWSGSHSYALHNAIERIKHSFGDLYTLKGTSSGLTQSDSYRRLVAAVDFVRSALDDLDRSRLKDSARLRSSDDWVLRDIFDDLADLAFDALFDAAMVSEPRDTAWWVQHNTAWDPLFGMTKTTKSWRILQFRLRRLLFAEVKRMGDVPNYKGARILGLILNVAGLVERKGHGRIDENFAGLAKVSRCWAMKNFRGLRERLPDVAEAVLIGGISFEEGTQRLVKTYEKGLRKDAPQEFLELS
jgi:hypothetical protein